MKAEPAAHVHLMSPNHSTEGSGTIGDTKVAKTVVTEDDVCNALGISMDPHQPETKMKARETEYVVIPDPTSEAVDLSDLRGIKAPTNATEQRGKYSPCETINARDNMSSSIIV